MFPPGRARLATSPRPRGSPLCPMTMGIVVVACLAARVGSTPAATITSTLRRTSSAARPGSRSACESAYRHSIARFCPRYIQLAQPLTESLDAGGVGGSGRDSQKPEPRDFRGLRLDRERRGEEGQSEGGWGYEPGEPQGGSSWSLGGQGGGHPWGEPPRPYQGAGSGATGIPNPAPSGAESVKDGTGDGVGSAASRTSLSSGEGAGKHGRARSAAASLEIERPRETRGR
jgi:hypothetical protein